MNKIKEEKKMVRIKLLLSAFCLLLIGQSCVHGELDDCPPMVNYAVAFTYTNHTGNRDRFYDDVKKINLYVFDSEKYIYTTTAAVSPYEKNFNIPLDLPMGNYHIIAWCNALSTEPFEITPATFVKGETTLQQARLTLQKTAGALNNSPLEKLFFGEIQAEIPLYASRIDTIPLTNDTKHVRVTLHWHYKDIPLSDRINHDNMEVRLSGVNAKYKFDNGNDPLGVTYAPYDNNMLASEIKADTFKWLKIYYFSNDFKQIMDTRIYDFSVLRLFKDIPLMLSLDYSNKDERYMISIHNEDIISRQTGFGYLFYYDMQLPENQWQNTFDKYDHYGVDVYIVQDAADTFVTGGIHVLPWHKVTEVEGGGAN